MKDFVAPVIEYGLISPILILLGAAVIGVLVEAIMPRSSRYLAQMTVTIGGILLALIFVPLQVLPNLKSAPGKVAAMGALAVDKPAVAIWLVLLVFGLLGTFLFAERKLNHGVLSFAGQAAALPGTEAEAEAAAKGFEHTEVFPLLLFALSGMLIFPTASDLLTLFVALEVLSLPLYLLCGLARRRRLLSQEAALKYFLLGAFSSAFFLYGAALIYGYAGSMTYAGIANAIGSRVGGTALLLAGIGLLAVGMLFKVGAAPFHVWTPDVYQGAPTAVTGFMAAGTKVAAFAALLRLFYVAFGGARWDWLPIIAVIAVLTMLVGSIMALTQHDVKRMLAYSSVAHAGFILTGFLGAGAYTSQAGNENTGLHPITAVWFYLIAYGFTTLAAFAIVTLVRDSSGENNDLRRWVGLGKAAPVPAAIFAFLLLAMAGLPLTSGFIGKWSVFAAAGKAGYWPVVVVAVLCSAVAAVFYLRVIAQMFFATGDGANASVTKASPLTYLVIGIGTLATILLGIVPSPLLTRLTEIAEFIR